MEKKLERKPSEVVITLSTSGEEWSAAQTKEFNKIAAKINVPGFRKGHIPAQIARQRINPAEVLHEAMYALVNKAYAEVLRDEKINVIAEPRLAVNKVSATELEVTVTVALPPVVTLGDYKGIHIEKEDVSVSEEEINAEINKQLEQHATLVLKEDGEAALGDTVTIDFKGYIDDIPFEGGEAKGYDLKLGSNSFIPGFEDQLVGIKNEEEKTIAVKFPENYVESLAGKDAKFDVKCHDIKATVLPELDEDFVAELEIKDVNTVEEYKAKVSADLAASKNRQADTKRLDAIMDQVIANAKVEIADQILLDEANAQIEQIKKQVESNGLEFNDYLKINGIDMAKLVADKKAEAEHNIKGMLVVNQICAVEHIEVDSKALTDKYEEIASQYNMKVEDVRKALEPNRDELLRNIKNELFTKFILANND